MYTWTKNNPEKRDKPKGLACVSGCQSKVVTGADGKWEAPTVLCPVCIGWHAKGGFGEHTPFTLVFLAVKPYPAFSTPNSSFFTTRHSSFFTTPHVL